jgi:hypothetical protein
MNTAIIAPIFLLSLTFVVIVIAFACPGPICTLCKAAFAPLRRHWQGQQTSGRGSGRSEQPATGGQEQQEQGQQPQRELDNLAAPRE